MRRFAAISICAAAVFLWAAAPAVAHDGEKPAQAHILNCMGPSGHHAYMKETVCPLGKEKFQSLAMGVFSTFGTQLDGMPVSYLPLPPPLPVCPSNGFVIAEKDYSAEDLADIERVVTSQAYRDLYKEKHASFYLHAQIQKMLGRDVADYWYPLVIATWEAHQCGDRQKYRLYAESALEAAMQRLADLQQSVPEYKNRPEYWRLNILIPNFHRRLGNFDTAGAWLSRLDSAIPADVPGAEYAGWAMTLLTAAIDEKNSAPIKLRDPEKGKSP